jgi:hypothetical protein
MDAPGASGSLNDIPGYVVTNAVGRGATCYVRQCNQETCYTVGWMLWFIRKTLVGSYVALRASSRS